MIESLDNGGAEKALLNIIKCNQDSEIIHAVLCLSQEGDMVTAFKGLGVEVFSLSKTKGFDLFIFFKMREVCAEWQPDL